MLAIIFFVFILLSFNCWIGAITLLNVKDHIPSRIIRCIILFGGVFSFFILVWIEVVLYFIDYINNDQVKK